MNSNICVLFVVQELLSETEKLKESQPEQQRKGKKILIQEEKEEYDNSNDDTKAEGMLFLLTLYNKYLYHWFTHRQNSINKQVTIHNSLNPSRNLFLSNLFN